MLNSSVLSSIIGDQRLTELISEDDIKKRIKDIAADISKEYKGRIPIVIGVLNGSFLFLADIVRKLDVEFEVDFIKISSYGSSKTSSGTVRLLKDISADITGRDIGNTYAVKSGNVYYIKVEGGNSDYTSEKYSLIIIF